MIKSEQINKDEFTLTELQVSIKKWYLIFLSKWKIIILFCILGSSLGIAYSLFKKPIYTAFLTFALEGDQSADSGGVLSLASQFGLNLGGSGGSIFEGTNLIDLFLSRNMIEQTLMNPTVYKGKSMSFAEAYIQNNKWRKGWNKNPKYKNIYFKPNTKRKYFTRVHDSILGVIYGDLSKNALKIGKKDKKVDIITMEFSSTNEQFSKDFCESLVKVVSEFYVSTKSQKARTNMETLERQTDSIRQELNNSISGVAVANDNTFNLNPALNVRRVPSSRRQVDVQANAAILTELVKQTELAKISVRRETPLIQILDKPILPLQKQRFGKIKGIFLGGFFGGFFGMFFVLFRFKSKEVIE